MTTIANTFGLTVPEVTPSRASTIFRDDSVLIGIEHEFENYTGYRGLPEEWRSESDGSLRNNGIEYILREPLSGLALQKAVEGFDQYLAKTRLEVNERTSTHVHIDVRNLTVSEYRNLIFVYILLEDVLFGLCDQTRIGNPYCSPLAHSEIMRETFIGLMGDRVGGSMFDTALRYGAVSLNATRSLGSLEFRMRETVATTEHLVPWINLIMDMRSFAVGRCSSDYMSFLRRIHARGSTAALRYILGEDSARYLSENVSDLEERFATGIDVATIFINL